MFDHGGRLGGSQAQNLNFYNPQNFVLYKLSESRLLVGTSDKKIPRWSYI